MSAIGRGACNNGMPSGCVACAVPGRRARSATGGRVGSGRWKPRARDGRPARHGAPCLRPVRTRSRRSPPRAATKNRAALLRAATRKDPPPPPATTRHPYAPQPSTKRRSRKPRQAAARRADPSADPGRQRTVSFGWCLPSRTHRVRSAETSESSAPAGNVSYPGLPECAFPRRRSDGGRPTGGRQLECARADRPFGHQKHSRNVPTQFLHSGAARQQAILRGVWVQRRRAGDGRFRGRRRSGEAVAPWPGGCATFTVWVRGRRGSGPGCARWWLGHARFSRGLRRSPGTLEHCSASPARLCASPSPIAIGGNISSRSSAQARPASPISCRDRAPLEPGSALRRAPPHRASRRISGIPLRGPRPNGSPHALTHDTAARRHAAGSAPPRRTQPQPTCRSRP